MFIDTYCYYNNMWFEDGDAPVQDDPRIFGMNVQQIADELASEIRWNTQGFQHNHLLVPHGCDFHFDVCSSFLMIS